MVLAAPVAVETVQFRADVLLHVPEIATPDPAETCADVIVPVPPGVVHDGTPEEFSVRICEPELLPGTVTQALPFQ
jgi:hypothetical protein